MKFQAARGNAVIVIVMTISLFFGCQTPREVYVKDYKDNPVSGAAVYVLDFTTRPDDGLVGYTNESGFIDIRSRLAPSGMWEIIVRAEGFEDGRMSSQEKERKIGGRRTIYIYLRNEEDVDGDALDTERFSP